jgi:DNA-binding transcriptional LysR family regulator
MSPTERLPPASFQFMQSCDTSSNISIIVEVLSGMDFTSRQFRAFSLVAQHRSFSRAAEELYITPSGLSVLIRELETQLGFRLFDRTTRHVGLTSSGSELLGVVRESLEKLDAAVSRVGQSAAKASLSLSVGAPPLVAADILPEAN